MYLEQRKTKSSVKYYLAHSFREGGKVHKSRVYLGSNIDKKILEERKSRATELLMQQLNSFKIIRSPINYKFTKREADMVQKLKRRARIKLMHLTEQDWERFTELFTYNTNAIEGNTITQDEVVHILGKNKWPFSKPKEDISETYGGSEAIKFIRKSKEHLSLDFMLELHRIIFSNSKSYAGQFRKRGTEVGIKDGFGNIIHLGAPSGRVVALLTELVKWYKLNKKKLPPIVLAAVVHNQFEYIHPFEDGNGRVGRLLMNNVLIKHKMPPVNIQMEQRKEYYEALRIFQHSGDIKPTIDLILREYKELEKKLRKEGKIKPVKRKKKAPKKKAKKKV
ncbi:MAG: Fic family protein [archaeon]|nr:Fic family protein [archaeon]